MRRVVAKVTRQTAARRACLLVASDLNDSIGRTVPETMTSADPPLLSTSAASLSRFRAPRSVRRRSRRAL
jgi:hypothetical protein